MDNINMNNIKTENQSDSNKNFFQKFICFDNMITPSFIKVIFWVSLVIVWLTGLATIISSFGVYQGGAWLFIYGVLHIVLGSIFTKVGCELIIVVFKIHESLRKIARNTEK